MDKQCPYCEALLQPWRFDFAKRATAEDIEAALENNPDLSPEHAIFHIPEGY